MIHYLDSETLPFGPGCAAPRVVCVQVLSEGSEPRILRRADGTARAALGRLLRDLDALLCFHRAAYDLCCFMETWPELVSEIWDALEAGRIWDTGIRDKVLTLARHGWVDAMPVPGEFDEEGEPRTRRITYGLDDLCLRRLGIEVDKSNPWRTRFEELDDLPVAQWPEAAREYALDDVRALPLLFEDQERDAARLRTPDWEPFQCCALTTATAVALYRMTCWGVAIDPAERARVQAMLERELAPDRLELLFACGILRRPVPARPHSRQLGAARTLLGREPEARDRALLESRGIRFTQPKPASKDLAVLHAAVVEVCDRLKEPIRLTPTGRVSTKGDWMEELAPSDPRIAEYCRVQALQKLVTTELPRIQGYDLPDGRHVDRVFPHFDELKETGRTSSWDPNVQNVDPRAKPCYVPEPGWVICSNDYSTIELVTFAQKLLDLFGKSHLAELIQAGVDPHAYLGAQMARAFDPGGWLERVGRLDGSNACVYDAFRDLEEEDPEYYGHWRTFAKPVGLGYPGGLGPRTMVALARGTYGVELTVEQASAAREVWRETFPEVRDYFEWITRECSFTEHGEEYYQYVSPCGMLRGRTTYCAAANGAALQTPAAEGGKFALTSVVRSCTDPSQKSILYGCRPWAWIHDEVLVNIPEDAWMHERAHEIARLLVAGMQRVIRDVPVRAQPVLMRRWDKRAKPVYGPEGRIQLWQPPISS